MTTPRVIRVDREQPDPVAISEAAEILARGGLVAFPTETVYGLGADALDAAAVRRIYDAKGRPSANPLIVHVDSVERARSLAREWPPKAQALADAFWPGPLTLVVAKRPKIPDEVTAGLDTVGLRQPSHPVAIALIRAADRPLAAPSANRYTGVSPTRAEHVLQSLGDAVDLVLDAGPTDVGIESTVVAVHGERATLLRYGMVSLAQLESVIGSVATAAGAVDDATPRPSPGLSVRHYSPRAEVVLSRSQALDGAGPHDGVLAFEGATTGLAKFVRRMPGNPGDFARLLYQAFWDADAAGCERLWVEEPPDDPEWRAVRDRLERASRK